jgi:hypothetical protein
MKRKLSYLAATLLVGHSQNALASDWVAEANVVAIEPFYRRAVRARPHRSPMFRRCCR